MKNVSLVFFSVFILLSATSRAQEQDRVIATGVPFLLIAADARAAGMGDQGVATPVDAFSQQWNPAKYVFAEEGQGFGINYTPYLSELVNDIFLGNVTYYNRLNQRSAVAASIKYFSMGEIESREFPDDIPLRLSPNEMTLDVSYGLRLGEHFGMAVAGRYIRSDLQLQPVDADASAASSFGVDIAAFYQSQEMVMSSFNGRWRAGVNLSNIGPKIKYDAGGRENFIPTNLKLGGGFDFILDATSTLGVYLELNKLLVPTPPGGSQDMEDYHSIGPIQGIFKSFGDAPNGFSEELKEITWALGSEYRYDDVFALRAGYFYESPEKGARNFVSLGAGFKYSQVNLDFSYLFSTSDVVSPLEGTLRFGLTFNFGQSYYE